MWSKHQKEKQKQDKTKTKQDKNKSKQTKTTNKEKQQKKTKIKQVFSQLANQSDFTFSKFGSVIGQLSSTCCHNMMDSV